MELLVLVVLVVLVGARAAQAAWQGRFQSFARKPLPQPSHLPQCRKRECPGPLLQRPQGPQGPGFQCKLEKLLQAQPLWRA